MTLSYWYKYIIKKEMYRVDDVDLAISWLFTAHARGLDVFIIFFVHPQKIIYAQFIVKATEFLNMNLVHFGVRLNHFYSCDHSGIN